MVQDRRVRNRTLLLIAVLALVNAYVFIGRDGSMRHGVALPVAAVSAASSLGFAESPDTARRPNAVRIFDGLDGLLRLEDRLVDGRTLRLGLLGLGVAGDEIAEIEAAVRNKVALGLLAGNGAALRVALDRFGGLHAFEIELAEGHLVQGRREDGGLMVRNIQHPLRTDVEVVALKLPRNGDLGRAIQEKEEQPELAAIVAESLAQDVDFMVESRPGDEIEVIVEKRYLGREFHRYGSLVGIRYRGAGGRVAYFRHKLEGKPAAYFDYSGQPKKRVLLRSPISYHLADPDAHAARAPTIEIVEGRTGSVYRRQEGVPVVAVADGIIRARGDHGDEGLVVELQLDDGRVVRYAHLMRTTSDLEIGQHVKQGQMLALVGHSGRVRSNQLRLEIFRLDGDNEEHLDPMLVARRGSERPPRQGTALSGPRYDVYKAAIRPWLRAMRLAGS